jgi:cytidyltransferase-like protein
MPEHQRVYVDLVGDLFPAGHVEFLRSARAFGDWLLVGVLSDEVVATYKRRPIMTLEERVAVVGACRYVDEVMPDAPAIVTLTFLREHDISVVVPGDDLSDGAIATVYAEVAAAGMLRLVPRRSAALEPYSRAGCPLPSRKRSASCWHAAPGRPPGQGHCLRSRFNRRHLGVLERRRGADLHHWSRQLAARRNRQRLAPTRGSVPTAGRPSGRCWLSERTAEPKRAPG